ncbi:hypothetical protein F5Y04DRAFT_188090 [Hypomontagnella monticulosa]|nr:hypothetical protein F5Y04DRAFT_188090 [Hypomontagnella monticulosa]
MESLPVELLAEIFSHFCYHCKHPALFPNADLSEARSDKRLLARICRTSKRFCAVAQPILYHYYATGNNAVETKLYKGYDSLGDLDHFEPNMLPQFLRSLIQRPDLALRVTAMHLVLETPQKFYEDQKQTIKSVIDFSVSNILLGETNACAEWFEAWINGNESKAHVLGLRLAILAMTLTPRLESLLVVLDHGTDFTSDNHVVPLRLPSLRTLALVGEDYHYFKEPYDLYIAAPKLETIYSCNRDGQGILLVDLNNPRDWPSLSNLNKLVISDPKPYGVATLLEGVRKLECLEYFWNGKGDFGVKDLAVFLRPVRSTLKKLCIGYIPSSYQVEVDPFPKYIDPPRISYPPLRTLYKFDALEDLSIDCFLLYPKKREPDEANRLVTLLPQSIRKLRITYIYRGIDKCLRQLAEEAPEKFPLLKSVVVGIAERTDPALDYDISRVVGLGGLFARSGIRFAWKRDLLGPDPRTAIPGAMPGSKYIPLPQVMDEIDDLAFEEDE